MSLFFLIIFLYPVAADGGNAHQTIQHTNNHYTGLFKGGLKEITALNTAFNPNK